MAEKEFYVQWDYVSSLGGPFKKGEKVTIDEDLAASINFDSPGVLKKSAPKKTASKKAETAK